MKQHKRSALVKKPNPNATSYSLYIHNVETLSLINELAKKLGNRNAVLNEALDLGVPIMYSRVFGKDVAATKEKRNHTPSVARELKELRQGLDDLFIAHSIVETLIAGLFNARTAELAGEDVNADALLDGSLCDLPELVAGMKADLMRQRSDE